MTDTPIQKPDRELTRALAILGAFLLIATAQIGLGNLHIPGPALIAPAFAVYAVMRLRRTAAAEDRVQSRAGERASFAPAAFSRGSA